MKQRLKRFGIVFLLTSAIIIAKGQSEFQKIQGYKVYFGIANREGQDWLVLRRFDNEGKTYLLLVNPQTLMTKVDDENLYEVKHMTLLQAGVYFKDTPYQQALQKAEQQSNKLQNAGITTGPPNQKGISLTADLCPSHRPLDRRVFTNIISAFENAGRPVPIALSISGIWMQQHPQDLEWLKQLQQDGNLDITWINHSFNHRVSPTAPLKENFLLEPGTDINYEVLETEKAMLKNGLLPSVFFRFPGLVSNRQLVERITGFGLIPIGSNAWLAKGQQPVEGSIALIHANGNEPVGVDDFLKLLQSKSGQIAEKHWALYGLGESVGGG
jgi:hypothetical protein